MLFLQTEHCFQFLAWKATGAQQVTSTKSPVQVTSTTAQQALENFAHQQ